MDAFDDGFQRFMAGLHAHEQGQHFSNRGRNGRGGPCQPRGRGQNPNHNQPRPWFGPGYDLPGSQMGPPLWDPGAGRGQHRGNGRNNFPGQNGRGRGTPNFGPQQRATLPPFYQRNAEFNSVPFMSSQPRPPMPSRQQHVNNTRPDPQRADQRFDRNSIGQPMGHDMGTRAENIRPPETASKGNSNQAKASSGNAGPQTNGRSVASASPVPSASPPDTTPRNASSSVGRGQPTSQPGPTNQRKVYQPCQQHVNELKVKGNEAHKNGRHQEAVDLYSQALDLARKTLRLRNVDPVSSRMFAQLLSNRSLVLSHTGDREQALNDARECIEWDASWYKGYYRAVQALKAVSQNHEALGVAVDALASVELTQEPRVDFLMEIILLTVQLHGHDADEILPGFDINVPTWTEIFKRLAAENKWHVMKLLFEEELDNMEQCGKSVFLIELVKYCHLHRDAMGWGQKLAIDLLQRKCPYPNEKDAAANTCTVLRSVLDLGLQSVSFQLLKYLLTNYDKLPARRNQRDIDGNTLLHLAAKSKNPNQETALKVLLNFNLDVTIKNNDGQKAIDCVEKSSPVYKLLALEEKKRTEVELKEMKRLISEGDQNVKMRKHEKALASYAKAVAMLGMVDVSKREASLLLCKLSQAKFEAGKKSPALADATAAVKKDGSCFESQRQLAKVQEALHQYDDAAATLFAAFGILRSSKIERYMDDILFDLAVLSPRVSGKSPGRFVNRCVAKPAIWSIVVTRLSGRRAWESLMLIFLGGGNGHKKGCGGVATGCSAKKVYLSPIVTEYINDVQSWRGWIEDLLVELIVHGADPNRLSDHRDEHPMVLALDAGIATGSYQLLRILFKYMAKHTDGLGRNLLHHVAILYHRRSKSIPDLPELLDLLIDKGVDPCQGDNGGNLPIDYANRYSHLYDLLLRMMERKKQAEKDAEAAKLNGAAKLNVQSSKTKSKPRDKCGKCQDDYTEAQNLQLEDPEKMFVLCTGIIKEKKHVAREHDRWLRNSQTLIFKIMVSEREVPKCLATLDSADYSVFIQLAAKEHWWLVELLLDMYAAASHSTSDLAKDIDLTRFFGSTGNYHRSSPKRRYEALEKILKAGASVTKRNSYNTLPLEAAVSGEDWGAISLLINYGAGPDVLTLQPGDTPLHVALQIAMTKDGGNFGALRCLLDLHASDSEKYRYLHPSAQDNAGDTLFHVAAQGQCTRLARKAVAFLFDSGVNPNLRNKAGKTALQCLLKKDDPRAHDIRMASEKFALPTKATKEKTGKGRKKTTQFVEAKAEALPTNEKVQVPQKKGDAAASRADAVVSPALKNRVSRCKDEIRQFLEALDIELLVTDDEESDDQFEETESDVAQSSHTPSPGPDKPRVNEIVVEDGVLTVEQNGDRDSSFQTCSEGEENGEEEQTSSDQTADATNKQAANNMEVNFDEIDDVETVHVHDIGDPDIGPASLHDVSDPDIGIYHDVDGEQMLVFSDPDIESHSSHDGSCDSDVEDHDEVPEMSTLGSTLDEATQRLDSEGRLQKDDLTTEIESSVQSTEEPQHVDDVVADADVSLDFVDYESDAFTTDNSVVTKASNQREQITLLDANANESSSVNEKGEAVVQNWGQRVVEELSALFPEKTEQERGDEEAVPDLGSADDSVGGGDDDDNGDHVVEGARVVEEIPAQLPEETETELEPDSDPESGDDDEDDDSEGEDDDIDDDVNDITEGVLEESVFNDLEWDMECTAEVWKILCKKDMDFKMKALIVKKLKMLGAGNHQKRLSKRLRNVPKSILLYEAKLTKAARIIWEIAIAFSSRRSELPNIRLGNELTEVATTGKIYAQVIRIWDIVFDHDNIYRSVQKIIGSHSKGEQCLIQKNLKGVKGKAVDYWRDGKRLPMLFTEMEGILGPVDPADKKWARFFPPASSKETEYHIMKFYSFDSALVNNILHNHGEKLDFPFRVTELEHAIINLQPKKPCPLLLLGRSGTGKTTCCLYRLWTSFVRYWEKANPESPILPRAAAFVSSPEEVEEEAEEEGEGENSEGEETDSSDDSDLEQVPSDDEDENVANAPEVIYEHLHQLFITKNPVLCTEVSKNFKLLSHAFPRAKAHVDVENEPLPNRLQLAHPCSFPLFLTSRQFLMILDGSLPEPYFFSRNPDGSIEREIAGWGKDDGPLNFIPDFDNDEDDEPNELGDEAAAERDPQAVEAQKQQHLDPRKEVTYEVFAYQLWSQMNKKQKATCHPSLVWTEINSFIKGSMEALNSKKGYLDMDQYLRLGVKRAPNFTGNREQVYNLFKIYQLLIKQRGFFDEMDVIFSLYNRAKTMQKPEWAIHQIYVDETQDFTQAELCLLIRCCQNPNDMFLTGDTAQSIMRGVAFRFSDLKSLFYYARESLKAMGKTEAVGIPRKVYQLTHNYRSHAGILNLASGIVDIMLHFFPESFDHLDKDRGLFDGPKPVLMECCDYSDLAMVLRGNKRETSQIEFGAHQAILVVNDQARDSLPEELSFGLVLTIYESKGLEFDDILLYNFFKDSQAKKEWSIVRNFLDELIEKYQTQSKDSGKGDSLADINIDVLNSANRPRPLDFDPEKHKILNSELKHLYTAVTRARVNIWMFDEDEEARKPMFEYFQALNLVQSVEVKEDQDAQQGMLELFSKSSTKLEWKEQGDQFFKQRLYGVAAKCYDKSGDKKLRQLSLAHQQALEASRILDNKRLLREKFLLVSLEYLKCEHYIEAAKCLQNAREYEFAANLYEKLKEYTRAADMYKRIKMTQKTSRMLELGKDYGAAIRLHYDEKRYDEAIAVLRRYQKTVQDYEKNRQPVPRELLRRKPDAQFTMRHLAMRSAEQHFKLGEKNRKRMMEALDHLTHDDAVNFLDAHQMKAQAAELLLRHGKNVEAAKLYRNLGKIKEAMDCIVGYEDDPDVRILLAQLKLAHARILFQRGKTGEVKDLVKTAQPLFEKEQDYARAGECLMLQACSGAAKKKEDLERASKLFGQAVCTVGEVECAYQLVKLCPSSCTLAVCNAVLLRAFKKGLDLVSALLHPSGGSTGLAREAVKLCESYYGLRTSSSPNKLEVLVHEAPRILSNRLVGPSSREMDKPEAYAMIVEELLTKKLTVLCQFVRGEVKKNRQPLMPCPTYRLQGQCEGAKAESTNERCPFMHRRHTKESFKDVVRATMSLIELDGYLASALNSTSLGEKEKGYIRKLCDGGVYASCAELIGLFYPKDRMETVVFSSVNQSLPTIRMVRNGETIGHLLKYAELQKEEYSAKSKYADILCADMFFCLQMVYMLCGKKEIMTQVLARTQHATSNLPARVVTVGFDWVQDHHNRSRKVAVNVFYHLFNMFHILYEVKDPKEAIASCNRYFYLVAKKGDPLIMLSYSNTMMMLEYQFALSTCMYLRHSMDVMHTYIPKSYLAHITFWDSIYSGHKRLSTYSLVQNFPVEPGYLKRLKGGLWSMIRVFSGLESGSFYMWAAFNPDSESCVNGDAERVLVFALTLILNTNLKIQNFQRRDSSYSLENLLMGDICQLDLTDSPCSQRLKDAVQAVKVAKGHQDIAKVLGQLLVQRGEEGLMRCVWKGEDSSGKPTVHCQKLESYDTLLRGFHNFTHDDLKESKSKEAVREELSSAKPELEEQVSVVFIQNVPEEHVVAEHATEVTAETPENEDPDLRIDDTMCSTCGDRFTDLKQGPTFAVADEGGDMQAVEAGALGDTVTHVSDSVITRQDHEASEGHKRKVEQCIYFKDILKKNMHPIKEKAKTLKDLTHPSFPKDEMRMLKHDIQVQYESVHKCVEMVRSKRDWENWDCVREAARKLHDANVQLITKVQAWNKEQAEKMSYARAVNDAKAATPEPDPQDLEDEALEKVVDEPEKKKHRRQDKSHRKQKRIGADDRR